MSNLLVLGSQPLLSLRALQETTKPRQIALPSLLKSQVGTPCVSTVAALTFQTVVVVVLRALQVVGANAKLCLVNRRCFYLIAEGVKRLADCEAVYRSWRRQSLHF